MKEKQQQENPFSKGTEVIKTAIMILIIIASKNNVEVLDYKIPIIKLVIDICADWISRKVNNSKTNQ